MTWAEVKERATSGFGDKPWLETERAVAERYTADPGRVLTAIDQLIAEIEAGAGPRSPWAVLRHRLEQPSALDSASEEWWAAHDAARERLRRVEDERLAAWLLTVEGRESCPWMEVA